MPDFKTIEALSTLQGAGVPFEDAVRLLEQLEPWEPREAIAELSEFVCEPEHVGYRIVVLQRGWVVVGDVTIEGQELVIVDARVIRKWGTTKGLGELASGPLEKTVLDDAGTVRAHVLGVVLTLDVLAEKWAR